MRLRFVFLLLQLMVSLAASNAFAGFKNLFENVQMPQATSSTFTVSPSTPAYDSMVAKVETGNKAVQARVSDCPDDQSETAKQSEPDEKTPVVCEDYVNGQGKLGKKGQFIVDQINKEPKYYDDMVNEKAANSVSMKIVCPGFKDFSEEKRKKMWAYVFGSISKDESTCGSLKNDARSPATNGVDLGEFQIEEKVKHRKWRGKSWGSKGYCGAASMVPFDNNALCAMDIMLGQFKGEYGAPPGMVGPSYWKKIRTVGHAERWESSMVNNIKKFPGCQPAKKAK